MLLKTIFVILLPSLVSASVMGAPAANRMIPRQQTFLSTMILSAMNGPPRINPFEAKLDEIRPKWLGFALSAFPISQLYMYRLAGLAVLGAFISGYHGFDEIFTGLSFCALASGILTTILAIYALSPNICRLEDKSSSIWKLVLMSFMFAGFPLDLQEIFSLSTSYLYIRDGLFGVEFVAIGYRLLYSVYNEGLKGRIKDLIASIEDEDEDTLLVQCKGLLLPPEYYLRVLDFFLHYKPSGKRIDLLINTPLSEGTPARKIIDLFDIWQRKEQVKPLAHFIFHRVNGSNLKTFLGSRRYESIASLTKAAEDYWYLKKAVEKHLLPELIDLLFALAFNDLIDSLSS